ncbi:MAG: ATP-binding protein, partial [Methylocella sp.]
ESILRARRHLALFCEREIARRDQRRIDMSCSLVRFSFARDLANFDFSAQPSIDRAQVREIAGSRFIINSEAVLDRRVSARRASGGRRRP